MTDPQPRFSVPGVAFTWLRDSLKHRGLFRTASDFARRMFDFVRDLAPARRRLRFGDLQFDFDYGVDTTWSNISLATRFREIFSGQPYQPVDPDHFREMMESIPIDLSEFAFIDLGSGKGRALLLASLYGFRRIIGVEILPELHAIAECNFQRFKSDKQRCTRLESWCGDARNYVFPAEPTVLYLFNPFFEHVLEDVIANLKRSLEAHPRKVVLIYANLLDAEILTRASFLRKAGGTHQHSFYVVDGR